MGKKNKQGFWSRIDKLSVYLPAVAMAVLALGTFWLVRNAPSFVAEQKQVEVSNDPDYRMADFAVRSYNDQGRMVTEMHGDKGRHYPVTDILEVDNVRVRAIAEDGRITTATAHTGTSFNNGQEIILRGDAVVIQEPHGTQPKLEFQGQELTVWPDEDKVQSDLPVVMFRGADKMTGNSLKYNKNTQLVEVDGRVRSTLQPTAK